MKLTTVRSDELRTILTALIVHDNVLSAVLAKLGDEKRPFPDRWSNTIYQWAKSYHQKYHKAPRKHIVDLLQKHAEKVGDADAVTLIESFLARLSKDDPTALAKELNEKYVLDLASSYFERVRLSRCSEALGTALENRDLAEAKKALGEYKTFDFSSTAWNDPFDKESINQTLRYYAENRSLIQFPGGLNEFLSPYFERDGFIAFQAPEKRGKSYWLMECVYLALRQKRKVLYYGLGDMSQTQYNRRLYSRVTRQPGKAGEVRIPVSFEVRDNVPKVKFKTEHREKWTMEQLLRAKAKLQQVTASNELCLKMRCAGASVVSASAIEQDVRDFAKAGWVPDMVVVDYADLLAPEEGSGSQDYRHQVNESWKVMRRISLDYHCLVVTATQAAASSYDAKTIRKKDFSEDKRKAAHVTGLIGINQTPEEKQLGVYRLNWVFLRDGEWSETQSVWTAGNLSIACPCILSVLPKRGGPK